MMILMPVMILMNEMMMETMAIINDDDDADNASANSKANIRDLHHNDHDMSEAEALASHQP